MHTVATNSTVIKHGSTVIKPPPLISPSPREMRGGGIDLQAAALPVVIPTMH